MSKYTFTDSDDETFTATRGDSIMGLAVLDQLVEFYVSDAEAIVKIIRQATGTGYYDAAPEPDEDACDQSDGEKSDPPIHDPHAVLAYRKAALDAALAWSSRASWPGANVTDIITTAARFEKFLFEGDTK
jgi:hypothetical protein